MVARVNSAEGGTSGATVTTGNSGGTSGDAWDEVSIPAGTTLTYQTAAAYKGSRGYRVTTGTTSGHGADMRWALAGWPLVRQRFYIRFSALPGYESQVAYVSSPSGSLLARVMVTSTGKLSVFNAWFSRLWTSTNSLAVNTWYRIEFIVVPGTTYSNGTIRVAYAAGDGAVAETYVSTAANTGNGGVLGQMYVGKLTGVWNANLDFDDVAADDQSSSSFLGVSAASGTPVVVDPTTVPLPAPPPWPPQPPFTQAIRNPITIWYTVDASLDGAPVEGATELRPTGGSITHTSKPGVARTLQLELAPEPGLFDKLAPIGTTLRVTAHIRYTDRTVVDIPMGVFDVDSQKITVGSGSLSLTAPDKWVRIQRAQFLGPAASTPGMQVREQIVALVRDALGADEEVAVTATMSANMGALTWEKDRAKAINDLAASIGAWVYFDRNGVCTLADLPVAGAGVNWLVDASPTGVLTSLDRERSRTDTYNVVVVSSSNADGELFAPVWVWDDDPSSPTYAGTDPKVNPASAGPFGLVTFYYDTPVAVTAGQARIVGLTILAKVSGMASQVSLEQVPNPAFDALDIIEVLMPPEQRGVSPVTERHLVETVTHPLAFGSAQHIEGRSTRSDAILGGTG